MFLERNMLTLLVADPAAVHPECGKAALFRIASLSSESLLPLSGVQTVEEGLQHLLTYALSHLLPQALGSRQLTDPCMV